MKTPVTTTAPIVFTTPPDEVTWRLVAAWWERLPPSKAFDALSRFLTSAQLPDTRASAARGLGKLASKEAALGKALKTDGDVKVQKTCLEALRRISTQEAAALADSAYVLNDEGLQRLIVEALLAFPPLEKSTEERLQDALGDVPSLVLGQLDLPLEKSDEEEPIEGLAGELTSLVGVEYFRASFTQGLLQHCYKEEGV